MAKRTIFGATVAGLVLAVAAVASAQSNGVQDSMPKNGSSAEEMPMMEGESSMAAMMMAGMADMMDSDQIGAMVDMMGDPDHVSDMTAMMSAHHSGMADMMSAAGSGMMSSDSSMGIDHGGWRSP